MPEDHDYLQPYNPVTVVFVPYWIQKLLQRNQLDYIELLNYDKLRSVLSIEDVAQLHCLNQYYENLALKPFKDGNNLGFKWSDSRSDKNRAEFEQVINRLAMAEATISTVDSRLRFDDDGSTVADSDFPKDPLLKINGEDRSEEYYSIIPNGGTVIFIVLQKGIFNTLEVRGARLKLVSEYLKALYAVLPMREVSKYYGAFEHYFNLL